MKIRKSKQKIKDLKKVKEIPKDMIPRPLRSNLSTDNTEEVVKSYNDNRIRYFKNKNVVS